MGLQVIRCDFVEELDAVGRTVLVSPGDHIGSLRLRIIHATFSNFCHGAVVQKPMTANMKKSNISCIV